MVSGRINRTMFGPSVEVHLTDFLEGRGRPGSGPLDGDGRRAIYQVVRRNFLPPMMLAFDVPAPVTTMGRRSTSNVPTQALTLMNNPFVVAEAARWGARVLAEPAVDDAERVRRMYRTAFARDPRPEETDAVLTFLRAQARVHAVVAPAAAPANSDGVTEPHAWADVAHVLFNAKEFIFLD